jgi:hypothetical protein
VSSSGDLLAQTRSFANDLRSLLDSTVCRNSLIGSVIVPDNPGYSVVGSRLSRHRPVAQLMRLRSEHDVYCWLNLAYRLYLDHRGYLTVYASTFSILTGQHGEFELIRYDYERAKESYPQAHIQVFGENDHLAQLLAAAGRPKCSLDKLHLPVGGKRFRPALEDVLEFLILERIVTPASNWEEALDRSRDNFRSLQLKAAVTAEPEVAADVLGFLGYKIQPPAPSEKKIVSMLRRRPRRSR